MTRKDYYEILGVNRDADNRHIRKSFRKLARKYHPDLNPGNKASEQRFKEINEAYEILSDPQKRTQYDTYGEQAFQPGFEGFKGTRTGTTYGGPGVHTSYGEAKDFGSIFDDLFGDMIGRKASAGRTESLQVRGEDAEYPVELDFLEAYRGLTREITLQRHGKAERISVKIPAGVSDGTRVRLAGMGHPGRKGGKAGDLYVVTKILPHPFFERKGSDIHCEIPVTVSEAALGGKIEVPTPDGMASMTIPRETQSGQTFRLKGKGFPLLKGDGTGDEYVRVKIVLPTPLRPQDEALFREIATLYRENPRAHLKH